jgi:hypothetical protein
MTSAWWSSGALAAALAGAPEAAEAPAPAEPVAPAPASWRFRKDDRPVKVVVLAGSIGAWPKKPYAWHIEQMCANVEVRNLSQTGLGAWALKRRFKEQVLDNRGVNLRAEDREYWLVFGGGLNSVGTPKSTNAHVRKLFVAAHAAGMKVVGLTLTPWGDEGDKRWRGAKAFAYLQATREVADFVLGRATPKQALGSYADGRKGGAEAEWDAAEIADIGVDLLDSPLRDAEATPRDLATSKADLEGDSKWKKAHRELDEAARTAQLEKDAAWLADAPRWYLRPELRSFDHVHPNADGHRIIAQTMCPKLPEAWGCTCTTDGEADVGEPSAK